MSTVAARVRKRKSSAGLWIVLAVLLGVPAAGTALLVVGKGLNHVLPETDPNRRAVMAGFDLAYDPGDWRIVRWGRTEKYDDGSIGVFVRIEVREPIGWVKEDLRVAVQGGRVVTAMEWPLSID